MLLNRHIHRWVATYELSPAEVDCAIAVMLKIIDGKCKMPADEKVIMAALYKAVRFQRHKLLDSSLHELIDRAETEAEESYRMEVYEQRLMAETMISRPVMKGFKARIRQLGLFNVLPANEQGCNTWNRVPAQAA